MKRLYIIFSILASLWMSCSKVLDKEPLDRLKESDVFNDPEGVRLYMANLYSQLPIEDLAYFRNGFNINDGNPNNGGWVPAMFTDEAVHSEWRDFIADGDWQWWDAGYKLIREVNLLIDAVPRLSVDEASKQAIFGECAFIRGYAYFALAKRYGGVPLISDPQKYEGDVDALKVPRSTESDTWDYLLAELASAAENLPTAWTGNNERRATRWAALALRSRAALHAASIAKFGSEVTLSGPAAEQKLVGIDATMANKFYQICLESAAEIMDSGLYGLYKPYPASAAEAVDNYRKLFEDPSIAPEETLFIKGYAVPGEYRGHNYDIWFQPAQTANGWPHPGRMNPLLDLVDSYESYDAPGQDAPIVTTVDGQIGGYAGFDRHQAYRRFTDPLAIFEGKDARLFATVVLPSSTWKDTRIVIQAGFVKPDGNAVINTNDQITIGNTTYYTFGGANTASYSGFDTHGWNNTRTGFAFKKFLNEPKPVTPSWNQSTTDFIDIRYAEVLLNYAEAAAESGLGDLNRATQALNETRRRAAHTHDIPLTPENVARERKVELAFENKRFWDLMRRREFHTAFNNRTVHALQPILDLRTTPASYIFVRSLVAFTDPKTFNTKAYYRFIPGIGSNKLVQNPQY